MFRCAKRLVTLVLLLMPILMYAQVLPKEGSSLNYRIIGFTFPPAKFPKGTNCKIEIAAGIHNDTASFKKAVIHVQYLHTNRVIMEVPSFGSQYTWRVVFSDKKYAAQGNQLHHFSTAIVPNVDTNFVRLRILKHTYKYRDCFVFLDGINVLYNMKGEPVWFVPRNAATDSITTIDDLKLSPLNTITCLINNNACEIDYNGNVLWKASQNVMLNGDSMYNYHHQLNKLGNGHYMVLSREYLIYKKDKVTNQAIISVGRMVRNTDEKTAQFDMLLEYDANNKLVWSWRASDYYKTKWLNKINDVINVYRDPHANSFAYDEKNKCIYVNFKNVSQILKIKYPEGTVLNAYGDWDNTNPQDTSGALFYMQHACNVSDRGYLYVFDNNVDEWHLQNHLEHSQENNLRDNSNPKIVLFNIDKTASMGLKKIWEYDCPVIDDGIDKTIKNRQLHARHTSGGNVTEFADRSLFASACAPYNTMFIVNKQKRILWLAAAEYFQKDEKRWYPFSPYRASIIKRKADLEKLIWHNNEEQYLKK